jgi:predicted dehydrogenase
MPDEIRWGFIGTGLMARVFAAALSDLPDARLIAVGSRTRASAEAFGEQFGVPHRHSSYAALVNDPAVDIVYVATPHPYHMQNSLLALEARKPVLCEKPFTLNAAQAEILISTARERGLFLMEAMWSRFLPAMQKLRELLADEAIGEVRMIVAGSCHPPGMELAPRLLDPELGGGALLDLGVYPISLTTMVLGRASSVTSKVHLGETGVDERSAIILTYDQGKMALVYTALRTNAPRDIVVMGTGGWIRTPLFKPRQVTVFLPDRGERVFETPMVGNGRGHEAAAVMSCLREGKLESETMPLDETLDIMRTLDDIRHQWGLKYPME